MWGEFLWFWRSFHLVEDIDDIDGGGSNSGRDGVAHCPDDCDLMGNMIGCLFIAQRSRHLSASVGGRRWRGERSCWCRRGRRRMAGRHPACCWHLCLPQATAAGRCCSQVCLSKRHRQGWGKSKSAWSKVGDHICAINCITIHYRKNMGRSVVSGGVEWSDRGVECVDCGGGLGGGWDAAEGKTAHQPLQRASYARPHTHFTDVPRRANIVLCSSSVGNRVEHLCIWEYSLLCQKGLSHTHLLQNMYKVIFLFCAFNGDFFYVLISLIPPSFTVGGDNFASSSFNMFHCY